MAGADMNTVVRRYTAYDVLRFGFAREGYRPITQVADHPFLADMGRSVTSGHVIGANGSSATIIQACQSCEPSVYVRINDGTVSSFHAPLELAFFAEGKEPYVLSSTVDEKASMLAYMMFDRRANGRGWKLTFACAHNIEKWVSGNHGGLFNIPYASLRKAFADTLDAGAQINDLPPTNLLGYVRRGLYRLTGPRQLYTNGRY